MYVTTKRYGHVCVRCDCVGHKISRISSINTQSGKKKQKKGLLHIYLSEASANRAKNQIRFKTCNKSTNLSELERAVRRLALVQLRVVSDEHVTHGRRLVAV